MLDHLSYRANLPPRKSVSQVVKNPPHCERLALFLHLTLCPSIVDYVGKKQTKCGSIGGVEQ